MTKDNAIRTMYDGHKVTHRFFDPDEWMKESEGRYEFEDGILCDYLYFWIGRDSAAWQDGWEIWK